MCFLVTAVVCAFRKSKQHRSGNGAGDVVLHVNPESHTAFTHMAETGGFHDG